MTDKAAGLTQHTRPVTAIHMMGVKPLPDTGQTAHRLGEMQRPAGQPHGVDGPGRRTDDNGKRIARRIRQQVGNRRQHADLIGRTGTATGKNQTRQRRSRRSRLRHRPHLKTQRDTSLLVNRSSLVVFCQYRGPEGARGTAHVNKTRQTEQLAN